MFVRGSISEKPFRWTINKAVVELKITANKVKRGLRRLGVSPGKDGRFSSKEIFDASNDLSALEREARIAKLQGTIDEAAFKKKTREAQDNQLVDREEIEYLMGDLVTLFVQSVQHSSLPDAEKYHIIQLIRGMDIRPAPYGSKQSQGRIRMARGARESTVTREQMEREYRASSQYKADQERDVKQAMRRDCGCWFDLTKRRWVRSDTKYGKNGEDA